MTELNRTPSIDHAENNAYFPSEFSLSLYTTKKTDFTPVTYPQLYAGNKKILVIMTDERYLEMKNGTLFSTGNHPIETLLPMLHLHQAGFTLDIATLSGNSAKLEMWAIPTEDKIVMDFYNHYLPQMKKPLSLTHIISNVTAKDSPYLAVFIPGGHGVMANIPYNNAVKQVLNWAVKEQRYIISLCHGPAALVAAEIDEDPNQFLFKGYEICVFPDYLDEGANIDIGYMPGKLPWLVGEKLASLGVKIVNEDISGRTHKDRILITGDSPLASNQLGILAAQTLLDEVLNNKMIGK